MFRKITKIGGLLILTLFVIVTLAFTSLEYKNATCRSIKIEYEKDEVIRVDRAELLGLVKNADKDILGKKV